MDIKHITDTILPSFEALKTEENIEVEVRLGKHNGSLFDTNVGKETWERVLKGLKNYDGWESTNYTESDVYYNDNSNVRITSNEDTGEQTMIQKISVVKEDFKCDPLDVRVCIAREIPTSGEYEMDRKKNQGAPLFRAQEPEHRYDHLFGGQRRYGLGGGGLIPN